MNRAGVLAGVVLVLFVALCTNPDEESFGRFCAVQYPLMGVDSSGPLILKRLQHFFGIGYTKHDFHFFTLIQFAPKLFLGAFGSWIEVPDIFDSAKWIQQKANGQLSVNEVIIAINIMVHLLCYFAPSITHHFETSGTSLFQKPWALFLSNFAHESLPHLAINLQGMLMVGPLLESEIGGRGLYSVYVHGGIIAQIVSLAGNSALHGAWVSKGASGAVHAMLGCWAMLKNMKKKHHPQLYENDSSFLFPVFLRIAIDMLASFQYRSVVDVWSHIGGLAYGIYYAKYSQIHQE